MVCDINHESLVLSMIVGLGNDTIKHFLIQVIFGNPWSLVILVFPIIIYPNIKLPRVRVKKLRVEPKSILFVWWYLGIRFQMQL